MKSFMVVFTLCLVLLSVSSIAWGTLLTAEQMYLDPSYIPEAVYAYDYYSAGQTSSFSDVKSLQVLPPLVTGGGEYYFNPTVDYEGDITGTDGSITFNRAGPYFVLATYTDDSTELFDYGIEFLMQGTNNTYNWHVIPTPAPDFVVVDPTPYPNPKPPPATLNLKDTQPNFPGGTTKIDNLATWEDVTNELTKEKYKNKHVELSGHGAPGKFYWGEGETPVLDDSTQATKDWLNLMKFHFNYLTFMSCSTGAGTAGDTFLHEVADTIGKSAGYTDAVGGNGSEWFINNDGELNVVPEPGTICLLGLGVLGLLRKRKRS